MEYIECKHCGKRYAASRIKNNIGSYIRCDNCLEKFQATVKNIKRKKNSNIEKFWDPTLTAAPKHAQKSFEKSEALLQAESDHLPEQEVEVITDTDERRSSIADWNPAETMPETSSEEGEHPKNLPDDKAQAQAEVTLQDIRQTKRKKLMVYALLVTALTLLGLSLWILFSDDEPKNLAVQHIQVVPRLSPEDIDKKSVECRAAAARQWWLDYKAMHQDYDAKTLINMIQQAKIREEDVKVACRNTKLLEVILDAATQGEKPDWFASEIQAISQK
ncbi:MAG: hypothetical protein Q9N67_04885 [Ghiorsea sp.]|nr:hypothetical protein [Ghiorsea sp.]